MKPLRIKTAHVVLVVIALVVGYVPLASAARVPHDSVAATAAPDSKGDVGVLLAEAIADIGDELNDGDDSDAEGDPMEDDGDGDDADDMGL